MWAQEIQTIHGFLENHHVISVIGFLLHFTFPVIVFVISANLTFREIGKELKNPLLLVKTFLVACIFTPLVTAGVVRLLNVPLLLGGIMLISSVAPGDPFDLVEAKGKKGSLSVAAVIMPFLVLLMPLTVPLWLWVFSQLFPLHLSLSPVMLFKEVAPLTIVPLLAGILFNKFLPKFTKIIQPILEWFFRISVIILVLVFIVPSIEAMAKFNFASYAAIFIIISASLFAGYYAGGSNRKDRISLSVTSGLGNLAVIMLVAHVCYPKVHSLFTVFAFVIVRWAIFVFWFLLLRGRLYLRGEKLK
jgi:BASS family bile acid:Na+ symporter